MIPALRWLLGLTLLLTVLDAGRVPLFEPDEGRYGEIPREMLASGDFVTPRLNGVLYFEKPALHYWTVAGSLAAFGHNEWASRLPTKLATVGMSLLVLLYARKRYGERVALLGALLTGTSALVFCLGRMNLIDPSLSLAMAAAAFAFAAFQEHEANGDGPRAQRALFGLHAACAAAVMLKGLIGIVLPGGAIVFWVLVTGRWRVLPRLFSPGPLALFLALAVPWHVLVASRNPDFLSFYFVHEHFDRFAKSEHRREGSPLYFVAVLLGGFLPWTGLLGRLAHAWPGRTRTAWRERAGEAFLWIYALLVFAFFSASRSKLIPYVEPIWPVLGLLLAIGLDRAIAAGRSLKPDLAVSAALLGLIAAGGAVAGTIYGPLWGIRLAAAVAVAGLLAVFLAFLLLRPARLVPAVAAGWLVFFSGAVLAFPAVARAITPWPLVEALTKDLRPGDRIVQYGHFVEVIPFYARRLTPIATLGWSELDFGRAHAHEAGLFLSEKELADLWNGPDRVFAMVHFGRLPGWAQKGLASPTVLATQSNRKHYLVWNGRDPAGP